MKTSIIREIVPGLEVGGFVREEGDRVLKSPCMIMIVLKDDEIADIVRNGWSERVFSGGRTRVFDDVAELALKEGHAASADGTVELGLSGDQVLVAFHFNGTAPVQRTFAVREMWRAIESVRPVMDLLFDERAALENRGRAPRGRFQDRQPVRQTPQPQKSGGAQAQRKAAKAKRDHQAAKGQGSRAKGAEPVEKPEGYAPPTLGDKAKLSVLEGGKVQAVDPPKKGGLSRRALRAFVASYQATGDVNRIPEHYRKEVLEEIERRNKDVEKENGEAKAE